MSWPLLLLLTVASAQVAEEEPVARLREAVQAYDEGQFQRARSLLVSLSTEPELPLELRSRARVYLAGSYYALDDLASARAQLLALARENPDFRIDPAVFLPELVALMEEARIRVEREQVEEEQRREALAAREAEERAQAVELARIRAEATPAPLWASLVPFGVGQFHNRQPAKAWLFLGGELAAFSVSAGALGWLEAMKEPGGSFLRSGVVRDLETAQALNWTYVTAFWVGAALAAAGITDALLSRGTQGHPVTAVSLSIEPAGLRVTF